MNVRNPNCGVCGALKVERRGRLECQPCAYCDADVDGGCTSAAGSSDCLREQLQAAEQELKKLRRYRRLPFSMDRDAQAAALADLPLSVAQEAGEFYENAHAPQPKGTILKREAMAVAWGSVLRPYLIGLRDHAKAQGRAEGSDIAVRLHAALVQLVTSLEGVDTPLNHDQEVAYECAASLLDELSPDPA